MLNECFLCHPTVFAVEDKYQIILPVNCDMLFWVRVGNSNYYDEYNGIMRSAVRLHRVEVPQAELDEAEKYTICFRKMIDRKPYFPESEPEEQLEYTFKPLKKTENINIYQIADSHGMIEPSSAAAGYFGDDLDLLVLNGDIADHSGSLENIAVAYKIAALVTKGSIPCVFSRGNHDLRGACAECLADYTPNSHGSTYYWFRVGCIFGIVADCGEDKQDSSNEYGYTVCCEAFRRRQTEFIKKTVEGAQCKSAEYRLIISHIPFTRNDPNPTFNIEIETYTEWARLLKRISPQLMLCGHTHRLAVSTVGGRLDDKGQPCPVITGSRPDFKDKKFTGTALSLKKNEADILFTDENNNALEAHRLNI